MGAICGSSSQVSETGKVSPTDRTNHAKMSVPKIKLVMGNTVSFPLTLSNLNSQKATITSPSHQIRNFFTKEDSLFMNKKLQEILDDFKRIYNFDDDLNVLRYDGLVTVVSGKINDVTHVAKRRAFNDFLILSDFLLYIQSLCKHRIRSIKPPKKISIQQEELTDEEGNKVTTFSVTLLREYFSLNFQDLLKNETIKENDYELILRVLGNIAKALKKLHIRGLAFKSLTPSCIMIKDIAHVDRSYLLVGNSFSIDSHKEFLKSYIVNPEDYQCLDVLSLCFVLIVSLNRKIEYSILYRIRSQEDIDEILETCSGLPKLLQEFLRRNMKYEKKKLPNINEIRSQLVSLYHKGPQTNFKNDSVAAYLTTHHKPHHSIYSDLIYFHLKNKITVYNIATKQFNIISVFFNRKKWIIRSNRLFYCKNEKAFLTFARKTSTRLVKIEFDPSSAMAKSKVNLEVTVQYFYEFRKKVSDPELFVFEEASNSKQSDIYLFSSDKVSGESESDKYYPSYYIRTKYEEGRANNVQAGKEFEVKEGPQISTWKRGGFFFFDVHNHSMYIIPEGINIFSKGIRFFVANLSKKETVFKEGNLMMAISTEELFQQFCKLNLKLENFEFCCEIQHGVFLLVASRIMFILDFNLSCFYSFCSLNQIQNFWENHTKQPDNFIFAFEIRHMPFNLNFTKPGNNNVSFQDGHLLWLCKKDNRPLLCILKVLTDQAALVLAQLIDLQTGSNLLEHLPKVINDAWTLTSKKEEDKPQAANEKIGNYEILEVLSEGDSYKVRLADDTFAMKKIKLSKVEDFEVFELGSFITLNSSYLLDIIENFLHKDEQGNIYSIIIREYYNTTLENELLSRKKSGMYYSPKELAFLIRVLMKGLAFLKTNKFECGNIALNSVCITPKGFFKIGAWYFKESTDQGLSDILGTISVILSCCCLEPITSPVSKSLIDSCKPKLSRYAGVENFLRDLLNSSSEFNIPHNKLNSLPSESGIYKSDFLLFGDLWHGINLSLQYSELNIQEISSDMKEIFWICYASNYFLISDIINQTFRKIEVYKPEGDDDPYDFSSYNMFTYDLNNTLYIVGSNRRGDFQDFFSIGLETSQKLVRLADIPSGVIMPSAVYVKKNHSIYLFGGYSIIGDRKEPSKKAFRYNITSETWQELPLMPLALVSATAVFDKLGKIFLFGGESEEIDLTCPELVYMTYSLEHNSYELQVNYSLKSPFKNSRLLKPIIIPISSTIFLWYQKQGANYELNIFELKTGGFNLKFRYNLPAFETQALNDEATELFYKPVEEAPRFRQDELSVSFQGGLLYNLDENTKDLLVWDIRSPSKTHFRVVPCQIIKDDDLNKSIEIFEKENLD